MNTLAQDLRNATSSLYPIRYSRTTGKHYWMNTAGTAGLSPLVLWYGNRKPDGTYYAVDALARYDDSSMADHPRDWYEGMMPADAVVMPTADVINDMRTAMAHIDQALGWSMSPMGGKAYDLAHEARDAIREWGWTHGIDFVHEFHLYLAGEAVLA